MMAQLEIERLKLYNDCLEGEIEKLKAKVKRLQQSKLDKAAIAIMIGYCSLGIPTFDSEIERMSKLAIKQAKSLLAALEIEK